MKRNKEATGRNARTQIGPERNKRLMRRRKCKLAGRRLPATFRRKPTAAANKGHVCPLRKRCKLAAGDGGGFNEDLHVDRLGNGMCRAIAQYEVDSAGVKAAPRAVTRVEVSRSASGRALVPVRQQRAALGHGVRPIVRAVGVSPERPPRQMRFACRV